METNKEKMKPLVYLIILNYNMKKWLEQCLPSVLMTDYPNYKVVVVDNVSTDGSREWIRRKYPKITLIENQRNLGFAEGHNVGIRYALKKDAEYVILLNPDIKVDLFWLSELVKIAEQDKKIGILNPMQYDYQGNKIDPNFFKILKGNKSFLNDWKDKNLKEVYQISTAIGGAMMVGKEAIEKVGLMDKLYFLYVEESDWCRRMIYHGFKIGGVVKSKVYHWHRLLHGEEMSRRAKYLFLRNQFLYLLKDPNKSFWKNLYIYFRWGAKKIIRHAAPLKNLKYLLAIVYIQFWILTHLPLIAYRHFLESKGGCYL